GEAADAAQRLRQVVGGQVSELLELGVELTQLPGPLFDALLQRGVELTQLRLGPLAVGDVVDERAEQVLVVQTDRRDQELDRELAAIPVQGGDLDAPVEDGSFAGGEEMPEAAEVSLAMAGRDDGLGERLSQRLARGPAEGALGHRVPIPDDAVAVDGHERIGALVDDEP